MMNELDKSLLEKIADLTGTTPDALNIRKDSGCAARQSTENIEITSKTDGKEGIDIRIKDGTKGEKCYIPVIISKTGLSEMVYNDFYIGDDCDVEIVAGADLIPGKAEKFFAGLGVEGVKCYGHHTEMLADKELKLDVVSVCTYNRTHAVCTIDCLKAGIDVLVEKPLCVTTEEAIAIAKTEKETGRMVSVGFQPRMDENMKMIKKIVESGVLGKVYYIQTGGGRQGRDIPVPFGTSFIAKETGGVGSVGDIGCYSLDMVLNAVGYPKPLTVTGYTSDFFGKDPVSYPGHPEYAEAFGVDDFAAGFVRLEGGIILDFRIAWAQHVDTFGDTLIVGTKGTIKIPSMPCYNGDLPSRQAGYIGGYMVNLMQPAERLCTYFQLPPIRFSRNGLRNQFEQKVEYWVRVGIDT